MSRRWYKKCPRCGGKLRLGNTYGKQYCGYCGWPGRVFYEENGDKLPEKGDAKFGDKYVSREGQQYFYDKEGFWIELTMFMSRIQRDRQKSAAERPKAKVREFSPSADTINEATMQMMDYKTVGPDYDTAVGMDSQITKLQRQLDTLTGELAQSKKDADTIISAFDGEGTEEAPNERLSDWELRLKRIQEDGNG